MPAGLILTSLGRRLTMGTMPAFGTLTVVAVCPRVLQIKHNTILLTPQNHFVFSFQNKFPHSANLTAVDVYVLLLKPKLHYKQNRN
jgi:hypothetical protein